MEVKKVNLNEINFSEIALRTHNFEEDHIRSLADDIIARGLLNLPTITPVKDGKFIVTDGARRMTALKLLLKEGKIDVVQPFQIKPPQAELDTLADMIAGNAQIRKTANKQYIEALYRLATETEIGLEALSTKVGMSVEYILKLFKTLRLPDEILVQAEKGEVSISNLITLSDLAGKVTQEDLEDWVDQAKTTTAKDFAVAVADELTAIKEANKGERKEPIFEVKKRLRSKEELEMLLIQCETAFQKAGNPVNEARYNLMKEIFSIDEKSVTQQKADWDKKQADKEKKKEERKAAREKAKLEEMKEQLEKDGYQIVKK